MKQKGFSVIIIVVIVLIILGVVGYFGYKYYSAPKGQALGPYIPAPVTSISPLPVTSWKTFTNNKLGYSVEYPSNYIVSSCQNCSDLENSDTYIDFSDPRDDGKTKGLGIIKIDHINPPDISKIKALTQYSNSTLTGYTEISDSNGYQTKYVYFIKGDEVIEFSFAGLAPQNINARVDEFANRDIFEQMLTGFTFTQ